MSACVRVCMSALIFFEFHPSIHLSTKELERAGFRRGKWWKEVEREEIQDLVSRFYAGRHVSIWKGV